MSKVGIITCGQEPNYGACLQSLATQLIIERLGYDAELLNYSFMREKEYSIFGSASVKEATTNLLFYRLRRGLHYAFSQFRSSHMRYSDVQLRTSEDFRAITNRYDVLLVGSDQVWNPRLGIDVDVTLLKFYDRKRGPRKISYASSFGISELPSELFSEYGSALCDFDSISVREETGRQIISKIVGIDVPVVVDPTLLFTAEDWNAFSDDEKTPKQEYVLIYDMMHCSEVRQIASRLSREYDAPTIALSRIKLPGVHTLYDVSPAHFLSLFKHARAIVTDSFHGTIFSILNQRDFYSFCPYGNQRNTRIVGLLNQLGLSSRLTQSSHVNISSISNYSSVLERLSYWRQFSLQYLKEALQC